MHPWFQPIGFEVVPPARILSPPLVVSMHLVQHLDCHHHSCQRMICEHDVSGQLLQGSPPLFHLGVFLTSDRVVVGYQILRILTEGSSLQQ